MSDDKTILLFSKLRLLDKSSDKADAREWQRLRDELCALYRPLVVATARRLIAALAMDESNDLDDLIQVGLLALVEAINKFDPLVGISFARFVGPRIEGALRHYKRDFGGLIREPAYLQERRSKVRGDDEPLRAHCVGLAGQSLQNGDDNGLDEPATTPYSISDLATARAILAAFLWHLDALAREASGRTRDALERQGAVVEMHFRGKPVIEIARVLDCSESNIALHIREGVERLRKFAQCEN